MCIISRYIRYLKTIKGLIAALILLSIGTAGMLGFYTFLLILVYDRLYTSLDADLLVRLTVCFLVPIFCLSLFNKLKGSVMARIRQKLVIQIRSSITDQWMHYRYEYFVRRNTSELAKRIMDDCHSISDGLAQICSGFSNRLIIGLFLVFFCIFMNWLFLIYLFIVLFTLVWAVSGGKPIEKSAFHIGEEYRELYKLLWTVIPGIKMIKLERLYKNIFSSLSATMKRMKKEFLTNSLFNNILWNINYPLPWLVFLLVLYISAMKIREGHMTPGMLACRLMFIWRFVEPLAEMNLIIAKRKWFSTLFRRNNRKTSLSFRS